MNRAAFYELSWQTIDRAIVEGLRRARKAVPVVDIPTVCRVSRLCTPEQLRDSLSRLERQGLIRRCLHEVRDLEAPLLGPAFFDAYAWKGGDHVQS